MIEPRIAFADTCWWYGCCWRHEVSTSSATRLNMHLRRWNSSINSWTGIAWWAYHIVNSDFEVTYEAIEILKKADKDFQFPSWMEIDLQTEHEDISLRKYSRNIFVIDYRNQGILYETQRRRQSCCGMRPSCRGVGEIIRRQREGARYPRSWMGEIGMNRELYDWYVDLRRYGVKTCGYGLGFEENDYVPNRNVNMRPFPEHLRTWILKRLRGNIHINNLAAI